MVWMMKTFHSPQTPAQGGQYIVQLATEKLGESHGIFYHRGEVETQAQQIQSVEKQRKVLQKIRKLTGLIS